MTLCGAGCCRPTDPPAPSVRAHCSPMNTPATSAFDEAIALSETAPGRYRGQTHPGYANMVGPFGGITAATALAAVCRHPERLGSPVALTVNFATALADGAFELEARPVRTNRSTQHWVIELRQNGAVAFTATAITATRRDTWGVDDEAKPAVPAPDSVRQMAIPSPVQWVKRYAMRPIEGLLPMKWDGSGIGSRSRLWVRDEPPRPLDFASLTALADVFYPRVWLRRATMVPAGTVSMTVYFHAGPEELAATGTGWLLGQARAQGFRNGFFDQTAQLWNEAGRLLATTHQVVYYKE